MFNPEFNKKISQLCRYLFVFSLLSINSFGQGQGNIWVFGDSAGVDFNSGSPIPIVSTGIDSDEPSATISSLTGQLLFYIGGSGQSFICKIWNRNHVLMLNGDSIKGCYSATNGTIILPDPANIDLFYIFSIGFPVGNGYALYYSIVDIQADSGRGAVVQKNILLSQNKLTEKLTAVRNGNGSSWWILVHGYNAGQGITSGHCREFYEYSLNNSGVNFVDSFEIGSDYIDSIPLGSFGVAGQMTFSKRGNKLGAVSTGIVDVFDFDRCTGEIKNWLNLSPGTYNYPDDNYYGISFSPNESKLYVSRCDSYMNTWVGETYQYNLNAPVVSSTKTQIFSTNGRQYVYPGQLQIGPDDKIYIATEYNDYMTGITWDSTNMNLSVINNPDSLGSACNYLPYSVSLGGKKCYNGLPNMPNYNLGPLQCDSSNSIREVKEERIFISPNPSSGFCKINYYAPLVEGGYLILSDIYNHEIMNLPLEPGVKNQNFNIERYVEGIYFYRFIENGVIKQSGKILIIK